MSSFLASMRNTETCLLQWSLLSKIAPTIQRLNCKIRDNPLENPEIFEKMKFQLEAQYYDENLANENIFDHI